MKMIQIKHKGSFKNTERFFNRVVSLNTYNILVKYAEEGLQALKAATPVDTGKTAASWNYKIEQNRKSTKIVWTNDNVSNGTPIALVIQYGHVTRNGVHIEGRDYINPALEPIFKNMANEVWREVGK